MKENPPPAAALCTNALDVNEKFTSVGNTMLNGKKNTPTIIAQDIKNAFDLVYEPEHRNAVIIGAQTSMVIVPAILEIQTLELFQEMVMRHLWIWLMTGIEIGYNTNYATIADVPVAELSALHVSQTQNIYAYSTRLLDYVVDDVPVICTRLYTDYDDYSEARLRSLTNRLCEAGLIAARTPSLIRFEIKTD